MVKGDEVLKNLLATCASACYHKPFIKVSGFFLVHSALDGKDETTPRLLS